MPVRRRYHLVVLAWLLYSLAMIVLAMQVDERLGFLAVLGGLGFVLYLRRLKCAACDKFIGLNRWGASTLRVPRHCRSCGADLDA